MADLKASKRRGLVHRVKLWLRRPATLKTGIFVLNVINLALRLLNLLK